MRSVGLSRGAEPAAQIAHWPMPGGPSARGKTFGYFSATNCAVPTGAARPDAGWAFAKFQASPEGQKYVQETENSWDQAVIPAVANNPAVLAKQPWRKRAARPASPSLVPPTSRRR
jgi:ABC-type glycerol-3-phosphate transport system substrate-binding protein